MAMWADNVKFVKDIIDSKYQKIDSAIAEVIMENDVLKAFESLAKRWKESQFKYFLRGSFAIMYCIWAFKIPEQQMEKMQCISNWG